MAVKMRPWMGDYLSLRFLGTSHGELVGMTLSGLPAGEAIDLARLQAFLNTRAPGGPLASGRREPDAPRFVDGLDADARLSGGQLTGAIDNLDVRSADYELLRDTPRPSHADYTARLRYGQAHDPRGGGMLSGRMTAPLCLAGGVCLQLLERRGIRIGAQLVAVGSARGLGYDPTSDAIPAHVDGFPSIDEAGAARMRDEILAAKAAGDSVGGVIELIALGVPGGLGDPLFMGVENRLAALLFCVPGLTGVGFGDGFEGAGLRGSAHNDAFVLRDGQIQTETNRAGGILGGITSGMPIVLRAALKPTPSIALPQRTVDLSSLTETTIQIQGRHDPCIALRAVPAVVSCAALVLLDLMLSEESQ